MFCGWAFCANAAGVGGTAGTSFPAEASVEGACALNAVFGSEKRRSLAIWTGSTVLGRNDHASAPLREMPQSNGEVLGQTNAAV